MSFSVNTTYFEKQTKKNLSIKIFNMENSNKTHSSHKLVAYDHPGFIERKSSLSVVTISSWPMLISPTLMS